MCVSERDGKAKARNMLCDATTALKLVEAAQKRLGLPYHHFFLFGVGFPLWPGCDGTGHLVMLEACQLYAQITFPHALDFTALVPISYTRN